MDGESDFVLRDEIVGLQAELTEAQFQRSKAEAANDDLRDKVATLENRLDAAEVAHNEVFRLQSRVANLEAELTTLKDSTTWRVGKFIMSPAQWLKRRSR